MSAIPSQAATRAAGPWTTTVAAIARREREVRDILWLLLTIAWVLAPHVSDLPVWCSSAVGVLIAWRAWLTWRGHRLPHRVIPVALTCLAGIVVWLQYRTIFGKDAGVAFIVLLLGLKLLEMRARRDIFVVAFLCLFVMLTALFESQSMAMAAYLVFGLWMLTTALASVQFGRREPRWRVKAGIAARLVALAVPLMAVLFVLFPRVDGPLWGMPSDAYTAKTGLSDTMAIGSFTRVAESRELAFVARFENRLPPPDARYWRGPVLGRFDGRTWTQLPERRRAGAASLTVDPASAIDYTVTLEPSHRPWLLALDVPMTERSSGSLPMRLRSDLQLVGDRLVRDRIHYEARSYTRYRAGVGESRARLQEWLELPPGFNPRTHALGARLQEEDARGRAAEPGSAEEVQRHLRLVDRVLRMIRVDGFVYTLEPPALGRDAIDEFLLDTRRGYCEHFAAAFVVLMRVLDIPARVVTGYQGGEINPVNGYLEVRQRDAHAWAEVWLADRGWMRVDPTAAVAPGRIELGASGAIDEGRGLAGFGRDGGWLARLVRDARFNWDAIGNAWNQWVLAYNTERQSGLLAGIGIERIDWQSLTLALLAAFAAVLAGIGAMTLLRRAKRDPDLALYARACDAVARAARREARLETSRAATDKDDAFARGAAEAPRAYHARMRAALPDRLRGASDEVLAAYERLRYASHDETPALRARLAGAIAALKR